MSWTDSVIKEVLPNGLTVLVQRDPSSPVVAVVTHVKAGYFDEPDEWVGIAHVLEHMFFKGSVSHGPGELARETQLLGGYLNAATIYDKTIYYAVVPSTNGGLSRAMMLQADALMHAALDAEELAREIEVIVQEAKRKLDTPGAVTGETLYEQLFTVHRMRRWRIGTEEGLRRLTADDLRAYYETRYTPGKVIIALTGDLDVEDALEDARRIYGTWDAPDHEIEGSPAEPPGTRSELRVLRGDVERPIVAIGWRGVPALHPDATALEVTAGVLGRGKGSLLASGVRKPGLASSIGSYHYAPTDLGVFEIGLTGDTETLTDAIDRSLALARELGERGPDPAQLERIRALTATGWARRLESTDGRATLLADFEALGDVSMADDYYAALMAVEPDDVQRAAATYLSLDAACATVYMPAEAPAPLNGTWPLSPGAVAVPETPRVRLPLPRSTGSPAPESVRLPFDVHAVQADGADLLVRRQQGSGLVVIGAYYPGIRIRETEETAGVSWLLARAALRGAGGLGADELAFAAESLGGGVRAAVGSETLGWVMTVRADAASDAAALLERLAADPTLDPDEVAIERALQADDAARARDDMLRYPQQCVLRTALPRHPYGYPPLGDPDRVQALAPETLRAWAEHMRQARPVVVAVGDLEPERLLDAVAPFAAWPADGRAAATISPRWEAGRGDEQRDKAQSALAMAFPGPVANSAQRYAAEVAGAILSGLAGRLFEELRERRALAYTVYASAWLRRSAGAVLTYIATSPEREDEARDAMLGELALLAREKVPEPELERARNYAAGLVSIRRQHAQSLVMEIADAWLLGMMEHLVTVEDRLRAVTADEIVAFAEEVFVPDRRAEFVVRGTGKSR